MGYLFSQSKLDDRSYGFNVDLSYLFKLNEIISIGPSAGYFHITGQDEKDVYGEDLSFFTNSSISSTD